LAVFAIWLSADFAAGGFASADFCGGVALLDHVGQPIP
jgi:hypothetical protein